MTFHRLTTAWRAIRRFLPPPVLRAIAPVHRAIRQSHLRRMEADDSLLSEPERSNIPPAHLRFKVAGPGTIGEFLAAGEMMATSVTASLALIGREFSSVHEFLDFGCGCGRLLQALEQRFPHLHISGTDVDHDAIAWCRTRFPRMSFRCNDEWPPCHFTDHSFDLLWCGSVFTHVDEGHQDAWLTETHRLLRGDGVLLASVHGRRSWTQWPPFWGRSQMQRKGFFFLRSRVDAGMHPEWYQVAWHTEDYVRTHWSQWFDIVGYIEGGLNGYQDIVVAVPR